MVLRFGIAFTPGMGMGVMVKKGIRIGKYFGLANSRVGKGC